MAMLNEQNKCVSKSMVLNFGGERKRMKRAEDVRGRQEPVELVWRSNSRYGINVRSSVEGGIVLGENECARNLLGYRVKGFAESFRVRPTLSMRQ